MDFGIVHAKIDEIGYITHAENLGYSHCWVTDSPNPITGRKVPLRYRFHVAMAGTLGIGGVVAFVTGSVKGSALLSRALALLRTSRGTQSIVRSSSSMAPRIRGTQ